MFGKNHNVKIVVFNNVQLIDGVAKMTTGHSFFYIADWTTATPIRTWAISKGYMPDNKPPVIIPDNDQQTDVQGGEEPKNKKQKV